MKNPSQFIATITLSFLALAQTSSAQFTLSGEIRPRFEYRHGYRFLADSAQDHAAFIDQRTRLNFVYSNTGYNAKLVLQDVRVWGSQPQLVSADGLTSVHEAWGEALITDKIALKFGRQEIALDDHRIFGSVGWAQQARSHDAGIFKYSASSFVAQLGLAYNQDAATLSGTSASNGSYKTLQYLWFHKDFSKNLGASVLFLNNGKEVKNLDTLGNTIFYKDFYSQTIGGRLTYNKDKLAVNGVFYSQTGDEGDVARSKISAFLTGFDIGYKLADQFTATLGFEMQSGNSQTDTTSAEVNHAFNPFYGTNHKFNGHMDYFYVGNHVGSVGLNDVFVKMKYKKEKTFVGIDVHMFSANNDVFDYNMYADDVADDIAAGNDGSSIEMKAMKANLGTEIDLSCGMELSEGVALKAGYSHMVATATLAQLKNVVYKAGSDAGHGRIDQTSNWAWLMLIVKPDFIVPQK